MTKNGMGLTDQFKSVFGSDSPQGSIDHSEKMVPPRLDPDSGDADRDVSLKQALDTLSRSSPPDDTVIEGFVKYFESLYSTVSGRKRFRHKYSDVIDIMYSRFTDEELTAGDTPKGIVYLEDNIRAIVERFRSMRPDSDELESVKKLQDHISLETIRIQNQAKRNARYLDEMSSLSNQVSEAQKELDEKVAEARRESKSAMEGIENSKRDSVAILGIFAAVVLTFNAAIAFSTSSVNSVSGYHPTYVAFVVSLVGFVLYNALVALFTFLRLSVLGVKGRDEKPGPVWGCGRLALIVFVDVLLALMVKLFFIAIVSVDQTAYL